MKRIAIIPARGGSKRIPRKNVKDFLGMPIIAYSITAALESGIFDTVMVSTDDEEIATTAREYGAEVPFLRSARTSDDYATTADVIDEVLDRYKADGKEYDIVACIYATAPFVNALWLKQASQLLEDGAFDSAFTCVAYSYPVQRGLEIDSNGRIAMKWPEYKSSRSQDLQTIYHDAGQFYFATANAYRKCHSFWGDNTAPIVLSELEVQDLDTPTDWAIAEMKYRILTDKK